MVCIFLLYFVIECHGHANMARISETAYVNSPFCGAPEGKFVILSRSKSCHINRMKTCIEIKKNPRISRGENKFEKMLAREVIILEKDSEDRVWHARIQKISPVGGPNSQKGSDGKFQHGKNI